MDWFLYDKDLRHERVKYKEMFMVIFISEDCRWHFQKKKKNHLVEAAIRKCLKNSLLETLLKLATHFSEGL